MIDTDKMREAFRDTNRGKTHREGCEYDHPLCAIAALCDELDVVQQESRWRFERMEYATEQHAELLVQNADLRRECDELRRENRDQAFQGIETQPGSPNFDGAAAWERYQKENPDWLPAPDMMPGDLAPAQMVEIAFKGSIIDLLREGKGLKERANRVPWHIVAVYRPLYSDSGLPMVSAEGLEPWAWYVATDKNKGVWQYEYYPCCRDSFWAAPEKHSGLLGEEDTAPDTHRIPGDWRESLAEVMK